MAILQNFLQEEIVFVAALSVDDARERAGDTRRFGSVAKGTAQDAWDALNYFDRTECYNDFEVYEITVTTRIRRITPPYTER